MGRLDDRIVVTPDVCGGKPRIRDRRITVSDIVVRHELLGLTADEVASEYDLSLTDVHAALAYYFDNKAEVDGQIAEERAVVESLRKQVRSPLAEKLQSTGG